MKSTLPSTRIPRNHQNVFSKRSPIGNDWNRVNIFVYFFSYTNNASQVFKICRHHLRKVSNAPKFYFFWNFEFSGSFGWISGKGGLKSELYLPYDLKKWVGNLRVPRTKIMIFWNENSTFQKNIFLMHQKPYWDDVYQIWRSGKQFGGMKKIAQKCWQIWTRYQQFTQKGVDGRDPESGFYRSYWNSTNLKQQ